MELVITLYSPTYNCFFGGAHFVFFGPIVFKELALSTHRKTGFIKGSEGLLGPGHKKRIKLSPRKGPKASVASLEIS